MDGSGMGVALMGVGMGIGTTAISGLMQEVQQPVQPPPKFCSQTGQPLHQQAESTSAEDPIEKLKQMKQLLDADIISQEEFDAAKKNVLGF